MAAPASLVVSKLVALGRESAANLEALIRGAPPMGQQGRMGEVAAEIIRCFDRALSALPGGVDVAAGGRKRKSGPGNQSTRPKRRTRAGSKVPVRRVEKKWTPEDGFLWTKYGHKKIINKKHPRLYFRCSYNKDSGCPATRHVQQSEDDPSLYVVNYFGYHTCCCAAAAAAAAMCRDDLVETQPPYVVINFGSANATNKSSSSADAAPQSSAVAVCLPEGGDADVIVMEEMGEPFKVESTSQPADASGSSSSAWEWDALGASSDLEDCFGETLRVYVTQLFSFDDNARLYCH